MLSRVLALGVIAAIFTVWWRYTFIPEYDTPAANRPIHSFWIPLTFSVSYLISLPILRHIVETLVPKSYDIKTLVFESMLVYNTAQVFLNGWMVWKFLNAIRMGHPWVGDIYTTSYGTTYALWIHYCDKYLEFFDTYFMIIRGRNDQVRFFFSKKLSFKSSTEYTLWNIFLFSSSAFVGVLSSCISSFFNCMGVVGCAQVLSRRGFIFWCTI